MPGKTTRELKEGKLNKEAEVTLRRGICPACNSDKWIEGPNGGLAVNVACSNGHRFWLAGPFTPEYQGKIKVVDNGDGKYQAYF